MKAFPESRHHHAVDHLLWFRNPYEMERDVEDLRHVESPEDYLLAYWIGRHHGLITPDM